MCLAGFGRRLGQWQPSAGGRRWRGGCSRPPGKVLLHGPARGGGARADSRGEGAGGSAAGRGRGGERGGAGVAGVPAGGVLPLRPGQEPRAPRGSGALRAELLGRSSRREDEAEFVRHRAGRFPRNAISEVTWAVSSSVRSAEQRQITSRTESPSPLDFSAAELRNS